METNGLWFQEGWSEAQWQEDWLALARRYRGMPWVLGFDLRNEAGRRRGIGAVEYGDGLF